MSDSMISKFHPGDLDNDGILVPLHVGDAVRCLLPDRGECEPDAGCSACGIVQRLPKDHNREGMIALTNRICVHGLYGPCNIGVHGTRCPTFARYQLSIISSIHHVPEDGS